MAAGTQGAAPQICALGAAPTRRRRRPAARSCAAGARIALRRA